MLKWYLYLIIWVIIVQFLEIGEDPYDNGRLFVYLMNLIWVCKAYESGVKPPKSAIIWLPIISIWFRKKSDKIKNLPVLFSTTVIKNTVSKYYLIFLF